MKRVEYEQELAWVKKWTNGYSSDNNKSANAAFNRLLKWYDDVTRELGYVYAQRDMIQELTKKNVELSVELDSALIELGMLRDRSRSEALDDE